MIRAFDRIMVDLEAGGNAKLGRLTDAEFRCYITGVLPLAAKSPIRGHLLVGDKKVDAADVARQSRMSVKTASRTLEKLRELGILEKNRDSKDEQSANNVCEIVHDFEDWNPPPKVDRTNADRQKRYRARIHAQYDPDRNAVTNGVSNGVSNGEVTPTKRREEKTPPVVPQGGHPNNRKRDRERFTRDVAAYAAEHYPHQPADQAAHAVRQAITHGQATTPTQIDAHIARHFPELSPGAPS
jgi:DNA-binding transcriptional ArsR family regulator